MVNGMPILKNKSAKALFNVVGMKGKFIRIIIPLVVCGTMILHHQRGIVLRSRDECGA